MRTKITSITVFILLFYIFPLLPKPELIFSPQLGVLILSCVILFLTQPPLSLQESKNNYERDKNSIWVIMIVSALIQVFTILEWAYFQQSFIKFNFDIIATIGLLLSVSGIIFRVWCIKTLGNSFTATIRTQENQKIVKNGAYKYIRHPSYLGAYLAMVGSTIFMHTYFSFFFALIGMFLAYVYRMKFEEIALVEDFGKDYIDYQRATKKIIPLIY